MKKRILSGLMACSFIASSLAPTLALADDDYEKQISDKASEIEAQEGVISSLNEQEASASEQLAAVQSNISNIKAEAEAIQAEQVELGAQIEELKNDIEALEVAIEKRDATIKEQARTAQVNSTTSSYLGAILEADSLNDAISRVAATAKIITANNDLLEQQEADKTAVEDKKATSEEKMDQLNENAAVLESKKTELEEQELSQQVLLTSIAADKATATDKKAQLESEKAEAEAALARQQEEQRLAAERAEAERVAAEQAAAEQAAAEAAAAAAVVEEPVANVEAPTTTDDSTETPAASTESSSESTSSSTSSSTNTSSNSSNSSSSSSTTTDTTNSGTASTSSSSSINGSAIVAEAQKYLGIPYVWGGSTPSGFDCSGLTSYVYMQVTGINIGRVTTSQEYAGTMISVSEAQAGDLVFFGSRGSTHHVGIYIGGGQYIHAPQTGDVVKVTSVSAYTPSFAVRIG